MANNSANTGNGLCFPNQSKLLLVYVYLPGVILHILVVRVLISKLKLRKQMHKFLLSLSVADLVQMICYIVFVTLSFVNSKNPNIVFISCHKVAKAAQFFFHSMIACSSGSIIALSVERYISCVHCFRLHSILTKKITVVSIGLIWSAGLIYGLVTEVLLADERDIIPVLYADAVLIFATSAVLVFVQTRLFVLIRRRKRVHPAGASRATNRTWSTVLRQVKIHVAVSAVAVAYITCMLPLALTAFIKTHLSPSEDARSKRIVVTIIILNPLLDSFIYVIGMREIGSAILSDFRAFKRHVLIKIFINA